ncbi:MAG: hypothetical protein Q8O19_06860, partial [Rectinemataceae bacterium]|nr:hypothetical protein [Rectinemataceae bacterium]
LGLNVYQTLLGVRPLVAYVNEQTYSAGLVPLYKEAGYTALVMEWNNAAGAHPDWDAEWRYRMMLVEGTSQVTLPLLWNDSVVFQKFQRFAHGESQKETFLQDIFSHVGKSPRTLMLYGNDAEIFDFRPGRFRTEAMLKDLHEWQRIEDLYRTLALDTRVRFRLPGEVVGEERMRTDIPTVSLESPGQPIPVKKQQKYNLARWALTGRDSLGINTRCYRIYKALMKKRADEGPWKRLCYVWDSDFRTHITEERFSGYLSTLTALEVDAGVMEVPSAEDVMEGHTPDLDHHSFTITRSWITSQINVRRGLVFESLVFSEISEKSLLGTLAHGYFDHVPFNADFYSGNTVIDVPGMERITDLELARDVRVATHEHQTIVTGIVPLGSGIVKKRITFDDASRTVSIEYDFSVEQSSPAVFHTGLLTFNPEAFNRATLFYATTNGGTDEEVFSLADVTEVRSDPTSLLVSSRSMLGNTRGQLRIGDQDLVVSITTDMSQCAALPLLSFDRVGQMYFLRTAFSLSEFDDTTRLRAGSLLQVPPFSLRISAEKKAL